MNAKLRIFIVAFIFIFSACAPGSNTAFQVSILPEACVLHPGEQIALTLDGQIPANANIEWDAKVGEVVWTGQGLTATYLAPTLPGEDVITVSFVATPAPLSASRSCVVSMDATPSSPPPPITLAPPSAGYTIVISEVMGNPCGGLESRHFNQYVELYNYGEHPVDVGGWWLFDEGQEGTPDQIVAWSTRSTARMDAPIVLNSTVIPAHGFAVVLSPMYTQSYLDQRMPYQFPNGTIILTIAESDTLGDRYFGIISNEKGLDTVTLYIGGATVMTTVVDTYGTPLIPDAYPIHIDDNRADGVPLYQHDCESVERVNPLQPDAESNWVIVEGGSPGEGPYK